MAGTVRSSRVVRMTALFAVFGAVVAIGAAAERGAANDGPSTVPEAAPIAEPSPTPAVTTTPEADPLPAPASSPGASPAAGPAPDPTPDAFSAAGTRAARITDATSTWRRSRCWIGGPVSGSGTPGRPRSPTPSRR